VAVSAEAVGVQLAVAVPPLNVTFWTKLLFPPPHPGIVPLNVTVPPIETDAVPVLIETVAVTVTGSSTVGDVGWNVTAVLVAAATTGTEVAGLEALVA
jgi:hypothetical protein